MVQDSAGESTIDHLGPGQHVVAAGPVKLVRGRRMLPVEPAGLVETGRLESLRLGDWVRMDGKLIGTVQFVGAMWEASGGISAWNTSLDQGVAQERPDVRSSELDEHWC